MLSIPEHKNIQFNTTNYNLIPFSYVFVDINMQKLLLTWMSFFCPLYQFVGPFKIFMPNINLLLCIEQNHKSQCTKSKLLLIGNFFYHMDEELLQCLTYMSYRGARAPKNRHEFVDINMQKLLLTWMSFFVPYINLLAPLKSSCQISTSYCA